MIAVTGDQAAGAARMALTARSHKHAIPLSAWPEILDAARDAVRTAATDDDFINQLREIFERAEAQYPRIM